MNQNPPTQAAPIRVLLAAGGTGGHLFPASALAAALKQHGAQVYLATDQRGLAYRDAMEEMPTYKVPAATVYGGGALALPRRLLTLVWSLCVSFWLIVRLRPNLIVGFGGYPSFGPVMMGLLLRKPVLVHEQNAVLGRANRLAVKWGAKLALSFPNTTGIPAKAAARLHKTGNPLRHDVLTAAQTAYRAPSNSRSFDLLVFGGSQGARVFSDVVPKALALLPLKQRKALRVVHQVQASDMAEALATYVEIRVAAEIRDFFDDMPARLRHAQFVICRGGASTMSELTALGVPALIVPLPGSLDQDQANNARDLVSAGAAHLILQAQFTPQALAHKLAMYLADKPQLESMAAKALSLAEPEATSRLARYAWCLAQRLPVQIEAPILPNEGGPNA
ncbi:undecaprenyldiphospho-muramoylpentapeptide beta-N-acetylglucosaminyltransferase [Alphaproteobacteria bacterium]|nr:undecaprenyldiphospho-muramoylpentapeptide beta-N-acetylglucosaminyltransferase [Alphaproteobacteria bacterium]